MQPPLSSPGYAAGWYPDPYRQFEYRWFNGERWTADVSVHGQRFVDPRWTMGGPTPPAATPGAPSRGFAVASLVLGLGAFLTSWMPFVFVVGALAAITGFVFGVLALRRCSQGTGTGRPLAIWGLVSSVVAAGLCVVGVMLTIAVLDEVDRLFNPGPYEVTIDSCTTDRGLVTADGTILNQDDTYHDYTILLEFTVGDRTVATDSVAARRVAPSQAGAFHATVFIDPTDVPVECTVFDVQGVSP